LASAPLNGENGARAPLFVAAVVPAFDAEKTVGSVVEELVAIWPWKRRGGSVIVVDDGSSDGTSRAASLAGAIVLRHETNLGKGAALRTGLSHALSLGARAAVTVDADGQHYTEEALKLANDSSALDTLILGVRDLSRDGAPKKNRFSNGVSNFFLSYFAGRPLADTQCGLRRYPLPLALDLGAVDDGYAFEAECVLRAAKAGVAIHEVPVRVFYPPESLRVSHFDSVRDPARIVFRVLSTLATARTEPRR
jgi:glycosyltransferase involved in cell wall biosynthesis